MAFEVFDSVDRMFYILTCPKCDRDRYKRNDSFVLGLHHHICTYCGYESSDVKINGELITAE